MDSDDNMIHLFTDRKPLSCMNEHRFIINIQILLRPISTLDSGTFACCKYDGDNHLAITFFVFYR